MDRLELQGLLLVACLLLAGCSGASPPGTETQAETTTTAVTETTGATETTSVSESPATATEATETTATADDRVTVEGDSLPLNATRTFERVERLMGTNGTPPTVRVNKVDVRPAEDGFRPGEFSELMRMNRTFPFPEFDDVAGGAREGWVLIRYTERASPDEIERLLAHEFAHVLQPADQRSTLRDHARPEYALTTDARFTRNSVVEGVAVYVADRYAKEYLDGTRTYSGKFRANWTNLSVGLRTYRAPYFYGQQYVRSQVESGADFDDIYANPPRTAEQVLHNQTPDEEPRRPLDVNATAPKLSWDLTEEDTKGELYVRHLLEGELSRERAREAAAGWGDDLLFTYYNGTKAGHVWTTRWDDASEASEFESALNELLDRRYPQNGTSWTGEEAAFRVDRLRNDTVALVAGNPGFSNGTSVTANESTVRVHANGEPTTNASGRVDPGTLYLG